MPSTPVSRISAERLFYQFLQKQLYEDDIWLFQMFTTRLVVSLGIWLHPSVYQRLPLLVPYAVRDPHSRGNKKLGFPDVWGAPNEDGYFRDDNSLVKDEPKSLPVASPSRLYNKHKIGAGFVAAHVWQQFPDGARVARHPLTYSFVPNLVWLPSQVAALTDRHGSFVQLYMQALAAKIYREAEVVEPLKPLVEEAWSLLPAPSTIPVQGLPETRELNFFTPTESWFAKRLKRIDCVKTALDAAAAGSVPAGKVISHRYTEGLLGIPPAAAKNLHDRLALFVEAG